MAKISRHGGPTNRYVGISTVEEVSAPTTPLLSPPLQSANKAAWVAYALELGADPSGSKADVIERVG